uniref:Small G protein signaling modulator 1a n=1 Tax=Cyprinus carpio TaxID=7962 RepID=A0A8C1LVG3_CYPCA
MEEAVTRKFVHEDSSHIVSLCGKSLNIQKCAKVPKYATHLNVSHKIPQIQKASCMLTFVSFVESNRKMSKVPNFSPQAVRHLWIHTALIEKVLDKIVLYLVENSSKFYEKEAILMDPVDGPILASLLVGPCALEYTKMKTADHFWTDPSADELVQRHRIHSGHCRQDSPTKRPALCIQKRHSSSSMDERPSPSPFARDYVESLHQNSRATLLFGKNNVLVQPRDDMEAIPGYLSLHQTAYCMTLKWTPNQLMNGSMGDLDYERSVYWDYAMTIRLEEIVYLHCHQQVDCGGTVVLVSQDGIQRPPLRFPRGGHLLQFLSCLENGLLPHGQLDPPLWSQRGKGKVFPKLKKRCPQGSSDSVSDKEEEEATDYVFRIVFPNRHDAHVYKYKINLNKITVKYIFMEKHYVICRAPLKLLCDNMKNQIISRAFYGWLAYCRHLSTVRTHLSGLVNHTIVEPDVPTDILQHFSHKNTSLFKSEFYVTGASCFTTLWTVDEQMRACYEQTMSEWLGCEAIVKQREKEQHAVAIAKCSSGASIDSTTQRIMHRDSTISNEVSVDQIESEPKSEDKQVSKISNGTPQNGTSSPDSGHPSSRNFSVTSGQSDSLSTEDSGIHDPSLKAQLQLAVSKERFESSSGEEGKLTEEGETKSVEKLGVREYSKIELLDMYTLNLHRIDKDVQRCDRNYWYFTPANLEKLRNIMCSYIWQHLEIGYVQGMCDLLAPLLVILDDEAMAFSCFTELMKRMNQNFPHGGAMDTHFANMRSLIQILDSELFELMHQNGDYTHFYFCYRWFLLDFKRELVYDDVFAVWEVIWAAKCVSSSHFVLFIALALVEIYRDIILENNMDFTDIIKFFNEMAEHHNIKQILTLARDLVCKVQTLIENK